MMGRKDAKDHSLVSGRWVMWTMASCVAVFVIWAYFSELDQVTRAAGQVVSSSRTQIIQSLDGGIIENLAVKEGMPVKGGQLLVQFSAARADAAWRETRAKAAALSASVTRLRAEVFEEPLKFDALVKAHPSFAANQTELYTKRRKALNQELQVYGQALKLANQELAATEPLLAKGDVGLADVLRLRRQVADLDGQIINRKNKYFQDSQTDLAKAQEELASVMQALEQRKIQLDNCEIHAPRAGVVKNIRFTTLGAVVKPGEDILELVPVDSDLIVEAKVRPADIGFIHIGMPTAIKIDAFDYSIFGSLQGEVIYISADTLKEEARTQGQDSTYYVVRVRSASTSLVGKNGAKMEVIPGMTASVEVLTGKKTIFNYLAKPIVKTMGESMKER
jgi:membrane fusion protein, adhesin transport system